MAASIKMDELLVSWLGNDAVYENVMGLIEKKKREGAASPPPPQPQASTANAGTGPGRNDGSNKDDVRSDASPRGVIPPFYVMPQGDKIARARAATAVFRSRRGQGAAPVEDQTWDGSDGAAAAAAAAAGTTAVGGAGDGVPNPNANGHQADPGNAPQQPHLGADVGNGNAGLGSPSNQSVASVGTAPGLDSANPIDGDPGPGGLGGTGGSGEGPLPCIRDQVRAIFDELGQDHDEDRDGGGAASDGDDEEGEDGYDSRRHLPVESFVRITKEVCQLPTFFNGPLYQRILEGWGGGTSAAEEDEAAAAHGETISPISTLDSEGNDPAPSVDETGRGLTVDTGVVPPPRPHGPTAVTYGMFRRYWKSEMEPYDAPERFFRLVKKPGADYIAREDFLPYVKELLKDHPGLEFLSNHTEFQEKYAITVITRIYYSVNRCHDGRITCRQIRRSDLLDAFQQVDEEEDINKVTRYFSYEHFYVLYCRFWELDHDRDYRITKEDLLKYGDHCLSHMIVDRIFDAAPRPFAGSPPWTAAEGAGDAAAGSGADGDGAAAEEAAGSPSQSQTPPPLSPASAEGEEAGDEEKPAADEARPGSSVGGVVNREFLTYEDFIFFMLSEEDKANEISIRYWFSCIDVDGDLMLNNMEMRSFYAVQLHRMQCMGHEIVPFEDMLCQMIDMVKPDREDYLVPEDFLKAECAQVSGALFDALFNLNKYLQFEQRDPFMERQKREDEFDTDWDRFACIDYNRLAMEEEAREEEAMEIDWVTVDDEDDDGEDFNSLGLGGASEAPF